MSDDRPVWAQRIVAERLARGWSQPDAVRAFRTHAGKDADEQDGLVRQWKRWESGEITPGPTNQRNIAATFGTVTRALFPLPGRRNGDAEIIAVSGLETLDIVNRLKRSDVDAPTMDALRVTVDRLCSEYSFLPAEQLLQEGRNWLNRVASMREKQLTLAQHRETLVLAGWLALLVGCIEYDLGDRRASEATRKAALSLGSESENSHVIGWAHEMRAWQALTTGDYRGVIAASQMGEGVASGQGVAVQLAAQEAKAWARMGDRRQTEVALDRGRRLLEAMPYPDNLDNHFVVDPAKFDYYAMDCYRTLGEDGLAKTLASEVIRANTDYDGSERAPMRIAEARLTLGVAAARQGDLESAIDFGELALTGERKSLPSLLMVSRELATIVHHDYASEAPTKAYLEHLRALSNRH